MDIIQVPFAKLSVVVDVNFPVLDQGISIIRSMKDMLENDLDISIQGHPLVMDDFPLIYRRSSSDVPFQFYTEQELWIIYRIFKHLSVKTLEMLVRRANRNALDSETMSTIEKINDGRKDISSECS